MKAPAWLIVYRHEGEERSLVLHAQTLPAAIIAVLEASPGLVDDDIQKVERAPDESGTYLVTVVVPEVHRAAFDARVGELLKEFEATALAEAIAADEKSKE